MSTPVVVTAYFHPAAGQHDQVVEVLEQAIPAIGGFAPSAIGRLPLASSVRSSSRRSW